LDTQKELYAGFVSKSPSFGVVVNKGCTITANVFLKLCNGCGVERISLNIGGHVPFSYLENGSIKNARSLGVRAASGKPKWSL
jgi:hypothetical protein